MISLVLGLAVIGGVISIFSATAASSAIALKTIRLDQQLRAAMDIMTRDIRRAGYRGNSIITSGGTSTFNTTNNLFTTSPEHLTVGTATVANDCIGFSYDSNASGLVEDGDRFGFRRNLSGGIGVINMRNPGTAGAVSPTGGTNCAFIPQPVTEVKSVDITALTFTLTPGCPYTLITQPQVVEILPQTTPPSYRIIRTVKIVLTGRLVNDTSVPARTLTDTVRVQNDRIVTTLPGIC